MAQYKCHLCSATTNMRHSLLGHYRDEHPRSKIGKSKEASRVVTKKSARNRREYYAAKYRTH